jgi:hypothetical protein
VVKRALASARPQSEWPVVTGLARRRAPYSVEAGSMKTRTPLRRRDEGLGARRRG